MIRKFLIKILIVLLPFSVVPILNWAVDPGNHFDRNQTEEEMISKFKNLDETIPSPNLDDRYVLKGLIYDFLNVDVALIGSSRIAEISRNLFLEENIKFFNNNVSGSTLEDYVGIYQSYQNAGKFPKVVILGVDPWILSGSRDKGNINVFKPEIDKFLIENGLKSRWYISTEALNPLRVLFSLDYFYTSSRAYMRELRNTPPPTKNFVKFQDGSLYSGDREFVEFKFDDSDSAMKSFAMSVEKMSKIEPEKKRIFIKFIEELKKDEVEIFFYIPPYHPKVYDYFEDKGEASNVLYFEKYIKLFAAENNIQFIGSASGRPGSYLVSSDFMDGEHLKRLGLKKIFAQ